MADPSVRLEELMAKKPIEEAIRSLKKLSFTDLSRASILSSAVAAPDDYADVQVGYMDVGWRAVKREEERRGTVQKQTTERQPTSSSRLSHSLGISPM